MKPNFPLIVIFIALLVSNPVYSKELSDGQIKAAISGKTVTLATSWGAFPLKYGNDKRVTGDGSGLGLARFFSPKETGKWWVAANQLCQKFPTWYKGKTFCFTLTQESSDKIKWRREDGYSGTATIE